MLCNATNAEKRFSFECQNINYVFRESDLFPVISTDKFNFFSTMNYEKKNENVTHIRPKKKVNRILKMNHESKHIICMQKI